MKSKLILLPLVFSLCSCELGNPYSGMNQKQKIEAMLEKTGAMKIGAQMGAAMYEQIVHVWQAKGAVPPDSALAAFKNEFLKDLEAEVNQPGGLKERLVDVYAKYFDDAEMTDLLKFYDSKTGKKLLDKTPEIIKASMGVGNSWGMEHGQAVAERVIQELNQKGYSIPQI